MRTRIKNLFLLPALVACFGLMQAGRVTAQTFTTLHSFTAFPVPIPNNPYFYTNNDGANPEAGLILSGNTLYGTASGGGTNGNGTIFTVHTDGTGFTNLYNFTAEVEDEDFFSDDYESYTNGDGANPGAGLILSGNTLYGTAFNCGTNGNGTVFAIQTDGTDFKILHSFTSVIYDGVIGAYTNSDGADPAAGLILSGNTLYGTAVFGGNSGGGTIFAVNTDGTDFTNLHSFTLPAVNGALNNNTNSDGAQPYGGLILSGNTLYGTASGGGTNGNGTAFAINTDSTGFTNLHNFSVKDGSLPFCNLILSGNKLCGTTSLFGVLDNVIEGGTVFAINTNGTGFTNLYIFTNGSDGDGPHAGLILSGNTLYGTAVFGGTNGIGSVFAVHTDGTGFTNLYSFTATSGLYGTGTNSDGAEPYAGLVLSGNTFYGTAQNGGTYHNGTVFSISLQLLQVTTTSLPNGVDGLAYSQTLTATGGQTPYTWTKVSGTLPSGLTLATNGVISGTPTTNGTFNFAVEVTDATTNTAMQPLTLTIVAPLVCVSAPTGLLSWWPGNGNALDIIDGNNGTFQDGATYTNGLVEQAFSLDGASGFVGTSQMVTNPQNFSLALWFKTTTTQGGVLLGFGDSQTGNSASYDRQIYMDNAGLLHFGTYNSAFQIVSSSSSYNDGAWHFVVAISSTNTGASLFVDGQLLANNPAFTTAQNYNGYWRIGENNLEYWPSLPSSYYFNGTIDEVTIFNGALSQGDVSTIYIASSAGMCEPIPYFNTSTNAAKWGTNGFTLQVSGLTGQGNVLIYSSTNLISWTPIYTNPAVFGSLQFLDTNATKFPMRFYRVLQQ